MMSHFRLLNKFLKTDLCIHRNIVNSTILRSNNKIEDKVGEILSSTKSEQTSKDKPSVSYRPPTSYRCTINDPRRHEAIHCGKFYKIDENEFKLLEPFNEILETQFLEQCRAFKEYCLMIRQPAVEIINYLKQLDYKNPAYKFILYGEEKNTGKSSSAIHVMHYCLKENWMLFNIPKVTVLKNIKTQLENSSYKEGRLDTPMDALKFLKRFKAQNERLLSKLDLKTTKEYVWNVREKTKEGTHINELIEFANNRTKYSSDICGALVREIKLQSQEKNFKVLVTANQINGYYGPTRHYHSDKRPVEVDDITIARNFKKLFRNDWSNAVVLGIVSETGVIKPGPRKRQDWTASIEPALVRRLTSTLQYEGPLTPTQLLKKEGFYALEPFIPINVKKYSDEELTNQFEYYKACNWLQNPNARDDEAKEELKFLSGNNPYEFMRVCAPI